MIATDTINYNYDFFKFIEGLGEKCVIRGLDNHGFDNLISNFSELRIEKEADGEITITMPFRGGTGLRVNKLCGQIWKWNSENDSGVMFSSNTGFALADGSIRISNTSWINKKRFASIDLQKIEDEFIAMPPDFIGEIRSKTDSLKS